MVISCKVSIDALRRYTQPTPIQMQAIPLMLESREILACAPTGQTNLNTESRLNWLL